MYRVPGKSCKLLGLIEVQHFGKIHSTNCFALDLFKKSYLNHPPHWPPIFLNLNTGFLATEVCSSQGIFEQPL